MLKFFGIAILLFIAMFVVAVFISICVVYFVTCWQYKISPLDWTLFKCFVKDYFNNIL
jgi:hypothetical protein